MLNPMQQFLIVNTVRGIVIGASLYAMIFATIPIKAVSAVIAAFFAFSAHEDFKDLDDFDE